MGFQGSFAYHRKRYFMKKGNAAKELFGFERVTALLSTRPSAEQIVATAEAFGLEDDITVLTIARLADSASTAAATVSLTTQLG
jgi:hypothetical protein